MCRSLPPLSKEIAIRLAAVDAITQRIPSDFQSPGFLQDFSQDDLQRFKVDSQQPAAEQRVEIWAERDTIFRAIVTAVGMQTKVCCFEDPVPALLSYASEHP